MRGKFAVEVDPKNHGKKKNKDEAPGSGEISNPI